MENKAHALAAGIFVLVVGALLVALAVWLTRDQGQRHVYEIATRQTLTGLRAQAPVRLRGVDVGKVTDIGFDPKAPGQVLLQLEVDEKVVLTQDTFATLGFQGVTGLAFVQLDDSGKPGAVLQPDDANPPRIPLRPGLMDRLFSQGESLMGHAGQVAERMNQLLAAENQKALINAATRMGEAAERVTKLANNVDVLLEAQLGPRNVSIPQFVSETRGTLQSLNAAAGQAGQTAAEATRTLQRLNSRDGPMDRLAEGTQALSAAADSFNAATLPRINRVTEDTSRAARQLSRTVNAINDNPQSLIFGNGVVNPGPGEPGFVAPGAAR